MRSLLLAALAVVSLCFFATPGKAETADRARLLCEENNDLASCDEMIAKTDPGDPRELAIAYAARALMRISNADLNGALSDLKKAQSIAPQVQPLQDLIARLTAIAGPQQDLSLRCLLELEPTEKRIGACTGLIDGNSGTADVKLRYRAARAGAYFDTGNFTQARSDLQVALDAKPKDPQFVALDISFDYGTGDYQTALAKAEAALQQQKQPMMSFALLPGQLSYLLGYHSMAIRKLTAAIHADPYNHSPGYWISLARQEDHEDADLDFQRMVDIGGPRSFSGKIGLFMLGKLPAQALVDAANTMPAHLRLQRLCRAYFTIGHRAWMAGDKPAARQAFASAIETQQYRQIDYQMSKVILQKLGQ